MTNTNKSKEYTFCQCCSKTLSEFAIIDKRDIDNIKNLELCHYCLKGFLEGYI